MDYKKIYNELIQNAKNRDQLNGYTENHHIIPRCMNGTDDQNNLVELTAKEHFIAHRLLCEIYPEEDGLKYALWMMVNFNKDLISSRLYKEAREKFSKVISDNHSGNKNPMYGMTGSLNPMYGKSRKNVTKNKIRNSLIEKYNKCDHPNKGRVRSDEFKKRMSSLKKKKVIHIESQRIFESQLEAADYFNIRSSTVSGHCNGVYKKQKFKFYT